MQNLNKLNSTKRISKLIEKSQRHFSHKFSFSTVYTNKHFLKSIVCMYRSASKLKDYRKKENIY